MISIFIGKPRAGKTTYLAMIANKCYKAKLKNQKKSRWYYDHVYCNEPSVAHIEYVPTYAMGLWKTSGRCLWLIDEAGIELNNREWMNLPTYLKTEAAMHGHRDHDIFLFSQSVDIDIVFRQRAQDIYIISKLGPFSEIRHIKFEPGCNNDTHEMQDMYTESRGFFAFLFGEIKFFYRPLYYKLFNSYVDDYAYKCATMEASLSYLRSRPR